MAGKVKAYTQDLESQVQKRTAQLREANEKLEAAGRSVMESIRYARLIQEGIMPRMGTLSARLAGFSLFHRQRDTVGGDFLYFREMGDSFLLGVIDCSGHGVPGAFMTMMANSSLDLIAGRKAVDDPAAILAELDVAIRSSLRLDQSYSSVQGGMDIGLCACFPERGSLIYAGAAMPLYVLSPEGSFATVQSGGKAVGYFARKRSRAYKNHRIATAGCTFFLVTDGFVDQAGGDEGRAFGTKRLARLLSSCGKEPLGPTCPNWEGAFDSYRGAKPQRDDALAIGFRI